MKQLDIALANLADTLKSARQIAFMLAGFSMAAIYLVVLSGGALRQEISRLERERDEHVKLLGDGAVPLAPLRAYYDGPVDDNSRNFASLLQGLDRANFEIGEVQRVAGKTKLTDSELSMVESRMGQLRRGFFELSLAVDPLKRRKREQARFEDLTLGELRDLETRMDADVRVRIFLAEAKSLSKFLAARQGPRVAGPADPEREPVEAFPARADLPSPVATSAYLARLSAAGQRSLADLQSKVSAADTAINEKKKHLDESLKIPFVDQPIDAATLAWVVPITAAIGILFCVFYLARARELHQLSRGLDANATHVQLMYPWVFLLPPEQDKITLCIGRLLQLALIGAPILASMLFLWPALHSRSFSTIAAAAAANVLVALAVAAFVYELALFSRQSSLPCDGEGLPPEGAAHEHS